VDKKCYKIRMSSSWLICRHNIVNKFILIKFCYYYCFGLMVMSSMRNRHMVHGTEVGKRLKMILNSYNN